MKDAVKLILMTAGLLILPMMAFAQPEASQGGGKNKGFISLACINIVMAANAGMMQGLVISGCFPITSSGMKTEAVGYDPILGVREADCVPSTCAVSFDIMRKISRAEWDTLLFFYGIILCVGGLAQFGYLALISKFMYLDLGATWGQQSGGRPFGHSGQYPGDCFGIYLKYFMPSAAQPGDDVEKKSGAMGMQTGPWPLLSVFINKTYTPYHIK